MTTARCRRFIVRGRVQGVFFRASTRDAAMQLKLTGHAINRADGSVEVLACGDEASLGKLADWLNRGPPMAAVTNVDAAVIDCEIPPRFTIG
jgi:acylphosphatase